MAIELVAHPRAQERPGWAGGLVPAEHAIRGIHSVTVWEEGYEHTARHLTETLGFRLADSPPAFTRPGPTLGRDNEDVYQRLLGMSDEEFKSLGYAGAFE